jgi:hypothetical protein
VLALSVVDEQKRSDYFTNRTAPTVQGGSRQQPSTLDGPWDPNDANFELFNFEQRPPQCLPQPLTAHRLPRPTMLRSGVTLDCIAC